MSQLRISSPRATINAVYELRHYVNPQGLDLFVRWLDKIKDRQAQARVAARLTRLENGNFGDCKPVGDGVWELRVDWGLATAFTTPSKVSMWSYFAKVATSVLKLRISNGLLTDGMSGNEGVKNENQCAP